VVPDVEAVADKLRPCLQEPEPLPRDFTSLFDTSAFSMDTSLVPEAVSLYAALGVKHDLPLTLIPPQFDTPLPPLQAAVFPPAFREPPPPALELFDLDEHFASERARLAQLAHKCSDEDIDYFVKEAGNILGITPKIPVPAAAAAVPGGSPGGSSSASSAGSIGPKDILQHVLRAIAAYKCLGVEESPLAPVPQAPGGSSSPVALSGGGGASGSSSNSSGGSSLSAVPGAAPLRHASGSAGLSAGAAAGFGTQSATAASAAAH
jgi:intraflagellar transport protein 52